jgi:hypothetical protein
LLGFRTSAGFRYPAQASASGASTSIRGNVDLWVSERAWRIDRRDRARSDARRTAFSFGITLRSPVSALLPGRIGLLRARSNG